GGLDVVRHGVEAGVDGVAALVPGAVDELVDHLVGEVAGGEADVVARARALLEVGLAGGRELRALRRERDPGGDHAEAIVLQAFIGEAVDEGRLLLVADPGARARLLGLALVRRDAAERGALVAVGRPVVLSSRARSAGAARSAGGRGDAAAARRE